MRHSSQKTKYDWHRVIIKQGEKTHRVKLISSWDKTHYKHSDQFSVQS
jgi:alkylated DNA nucleotide flippase Atl1